MSWKRLNYRFHNPNSEDTTVKYLIKILVEANLPKLEQVIIEDGLVENVKLDEK